MRFLTAHLSDGLGRKIVASAALSTMVFGSQVVARIVSTIILTRILTPEVFGVFAIVMTFIFLLEQFSDIGIRSLVLTREGEMTDSFLRSCWTAQILRGLLIMALCVLIALGIYWAQGTETFPAASGYSDPVLPYAIAAIGGFSIIGGFASPWKFMYEREMKFRNVSIDRLVEVVLTTVITILLAIWLENIWALVLGNLARALIMVAMSFALFSGPTMRLHWDREDFRIIIERGKWIITHSGLNALIATADRFVLGFAMGAGAFGFYYIARQIVDMIDLFLNAIHTQMGLQVFTALQKDGNPVALRLRYYRYRVIYDGFAMFGAGAMLTFAPTLVDIVYDDRYADVAGMIQILAIGLILIGPGLLREAFAAERRFREMTTFSLLRAATIWTGLLVATCGFGSVTGALFVIALHRIPEIAFLLIKSHRENWVDWLKEVRLLPLVPAGAAFGWGLAQLWTMMS